MKEQTSRKYKIAKVFENEILEIFVNDPGGYLQRLEGYFTIISILFM